MMNKPPTFINLAALENSLQYSRDEALDCLAESLDKIQQQLPDIIRIWDQVKRAETTEQKKIMLHKLEQSIYRLKCNTNLGHLPALNNECTLFNQFLKTHEENLTTDSTHLDPLYETLLDDVQKTIHAAKPLLSPTLHQLEQFLNTWDNQYQSKITSLPLFDNTSRKQWTSAQYHQFVYYFYHAHNHFSKFLYLLGNEAPRPDIKQIILANFSEKFGGHACSHEQLYYDFAEAMGITDIAQEAQNAHYYCDRLKALHQEYFQWLNSHSWPMKWAAFAAYKRLTSIDCSHLLSLGKALGITEKGLGYFRRHQFGKQVDQTFYELLDLWEARPETVKQAFTNIQQFQVEIWEWLSQTLYPETIADSQKRTSPATATTDSTN